MSDVEISVVMACHNGAAYLKESIDSTLCQTFTDFELIIADDASTDHSREIIQRYAGHDHRVRFHFLKRNVGPGPARNQAIRAASGDWIAILDCDDMAVPMRLEKQISFLRSNASVVLLGTGCTVIDEKGREVGTYRYPFRHRSLIARIENGHSPFPHSSTIFSRKLVQAIGAYNPRFAQSEDTDLYLRLSENATIACLPEPLVRIRKHASNISKHNGGTTAGITGMAAQICHFIRLRQSSDPSQDQDDQVWVEFVDWLTRRLEVQSYLDSRHQWAAMKCEFLRSLESGKRLSGTLKVAAGIVRSQHIREAFRRKVLGSRLASRLAEEWVSGTGNQRQSVRSY